MQISHIARLQQSLDSLQMEFVQHKSSSAETICGLEESLMHHRSLASTLEEAMASVQAEALLKEAQLSQQAETIARLESELASDRAASRQLLESSEQVSGRMRLEIAAKDAQLEEVQAELRRKDTQLEAGQAELRRKQEESAMISAEADQRMLQLQQLSVTLQEVAEKHSAALQRRLEEVCVS